eukprot:1157850-Pelagomonas_calceolata.AAC.7
MEDEQKRKEAEKAVRVRQLSVGHKGPLHGGGESLGMLVNAFLACRIPGAACMLSERTLRSSCFYSTWSHGNATRQEKERSDMHAKMAAQKKQYYERQQQAARNRWGAELV